MFVRLLACLQLGSTDGNGTPLQYSCLENPMDGGDWWATVHGVTRSRTRLRDFTFTFHFPELEKEVATHSIVLAWRIPETAEPGGLPSVGSCRFRHDWSDLAAAVQIHDSKIKRCKMVTSVTSKIPSLAFIHSVLLSRGNKPGNSFQSVFFSTQSGLLHKFFCISLCFQRRSLHFC